MADDPYAGKSLVELLDMLAPVPEPPAISMWPQTQGWIWLGLTILALLAYAGWRWHLRHKANAYRRAAMEALSKAGDDPCQIAEILRRTALAAYPRQDVASLAGEDWLRFLDAGLGRAGFESELGQSMLAAPYQPEVAPIQGLGALARLWVARHKIGGAT